MAKVGIIDILTSAWFITHEAEQAFYPLVFQMLESPLALDDREIQDSANVSLNFNSELFAISKYGNLHGPHNAPKNSIAVISFSGAITKNDQFCGDSGTATKAELIRQCMESSNIKGIVLNISSPGGAGNALEVLKESLSNKSKPVVAYIDELAASAGYWAASFCDEIVVKNERAQLGSIGTYITLANFDAYYKSKGLEVSRLYARLSTEKNKAFENALKGDNDAMLDWLDAFNNFFIEDVKNGRPNLDLSADSKILNGAMYFGDKAVENGLADHMGGWDKVVDRVNELKNNYKTEFYV
jgi:signal peptide peptidase SppA